MRGRLYQRPGRSQPRRRLLVERLETRCLLAGGTAGIYGIKFADVDRDGVMDGGEPPLAGIELRLLNSSGLQVGACVTDPTGRFSFESLAAGPYTLTEAPGNQPTTPLPLPLTLTTGELAVARVGLSGGSTALEVVLSSLYVGNVPRTNMAVERTQFSASTGQIVIENGTTRETVTLTGSGEIAVLFEGPQAGNAADDDGDGFDEVAVQLVQWQLSGASSTGRVTVALDPAQPAWGVIREQANTQTGRLDVPRFTAAGSAAVEITAGATVQIGTQTYVLAAPVHFTALVHGTPAATGDTLGQSSSVALLTAAGQATGNSVAAVRWTPLPTLAWQNPRSRFDVNGDGKLTAADVLTLVNRLNEAGGPITLPSPPQVPFIPPPFLDVNGDGKLTPTDVLALINELNLGGPYTIPYDVTPLAIPPAGSLSGGEGEALGPAKTTAVTLAPALTVSAPTARNRLLRAAAKLTVPAVEPTLALLAKDVAAVRGSRR